MSSLIPAELILKFRRRGNQPYSRCIPIFKFVNSPLFIVHYIIIILFLTPSLNAQLLTPLSNEMNRRVEYEMIQNGTPFFTVLKPYLEPRAKNQEPGDSTNANFRIPTSSNSQIKKSWFHRKLFHESFVQIDSGHFYLFADPVFEFGVGKDNKGRNTMINTRGMRIGGRLGKYFAFGTSFYENQAIFNSVIDAQFRKTKIIPGQGRGRINGNTWDYAHASGYLSFSPIRQLNLQFGQGKHFIGNGYRSLILSDYAYTYPYAQVTWQSQKWMYTWLVTSVQNMGLKIQLSSNKEPFKHETVSIHLLSLKLLKNIEASVIQCQIFNIPDTFGRTKGDIRLFNPILLPIPDTKNIHSLWGLNLKASITPGFIIYSQLLLDNLMKKNAVRKGVQLGIKYFNVAKIKGLYLQAEYNRVDPYSYTSVEKSLQWMHFGEPLAHPAGHNFEEIVSIASYTWRRWQLYNQTNIGLNIKSLENYTDITNPPIPYYNTGQKFLWSKNELIYYFNPKTLMNMAVGYVFRKETITGSSNTLTHVYFSFRTSLINGYYDR